MADDNHAAQHPAAARYRAAVDAIEADLVTVLRRYEPILAPQLLAHALVEVTGNVLSQIIAAEPTSAAAIDELLLAMNLLVATTGSRAQ